MASLRYVLPSLGPSWKNFPILAEAKGMSTTLDLSDTGLLSVIAWEATVDSVLASLFGCNNSGQAEFCFLTSDETELLIILAYC